MQGTVLADRYRLQDRLGTGSQGHVYRAVDEKLGRPVAVKVMNQGFGAADAEEIRKRFRREARLTALFEHPHVVKIYDDDVTGDGNPFLVMEHLEGSTLDGLSPQLSPVELRLFVRQVCSALGRAHDRGLIHRDLKPSNIMLIDRGKSEQRFVILDLGIAKLREMTKIKQTTLAGMTFAGAGTPRYMSPEQVDNRQVDHRSDIYSFGVLLFELLTGASPFADADCSLYSLLNVISSGSVRRLSDVTGTATFPPELEELIAACLSYDPEDRPASMQELSDRFLAIAWPTTGTSNTLRPHDTQVAADGDRAGWSDSQRKTDPSGASPNKMAVTAVVVATLLCGAVPLAIWKLNSSDLLARENVSATEADRIGKEQSQELGRLQAALDDALAAGKTAEAALQAESARREQTEQKARDAEQKYSGLEAALQTTTAARRRAEEQAEQVQNELRTLSEKLTAAEQGLFAAETALRNEEAARRIAAKNLGSEADARSKAAEFLRQMESQLQATQSKLAQVERDLQEATAGRQTETRKRELAEAELRDLLTKQAAAAKAKIEAEKRLKAQLIDYAEARRKAEQGEKTPGRLTGKQLKQD